MHLLLLIDQNHILILVLLVMLITVKQHLLLLSPKFWLIKEWQIQNSRLMLKLIMLLKKRNVVLQLLLLIKNMISGAASLDVAILVVDGAAGVMPQTREHLLLAKQVGVPQVVVWVNKCDMIDEVEILEIVEMDVKDVLALHSFDPNKVKFIRGSAL